MDNTYKRVLKKTTTTQFEVLVRELEANPDLVGGAPLFGLKKASADLLWENIVKKINAHGPPRRGVIEWKKIWADLKSRTKKRIEENNRSRQAAGGDSLRLIPLSNLERAIEGIILMSKATEPTKVLTNREIITTMPRTTIITTTPAKRRKVTNSGNFQLQENDERGTSLVAMDDGCFELKLSKRMLLRSYIGLVLEDNIPLEILDSQNMRNLIEPICMALVPQNKEPKRKPLQLNAQNCQRALNLVANKVRKDLNQKLRQHLISLKIDSIASVNTTPTNMLAISVQFIQGCGLESSFLGMLELKPHANDSSFNANLLSLLQKYQIDYHQVASIVADNGAFNKISALDLKDFLTDDGSERTNDLTQIEQFTNPAPICVVDDVEVQRCAARTAQLCTLALLKNAEIREHICNCRKLTKLLNDFPREIFEIHGLDLPALDCPTRWGSTYDMIDALVAARDILEDITAVKMEQDDEEGEVEVTHPQQLNNPALWEFCDAYLHIMDPLQKTLLIFQEEQLHFGDFFARWLKCKIRTNKLMSSADSATLKHRFGNCLLTCIEQATTRLLTNASFCACLFLDPRFHNTLNDEQKSRSIRYLEKLWTKLNLFKARNAATPTSSCVTADPLVQNEFSDDEDAMLNEFLSKELQKQDSSTAVSVSSKIEKLQLPFVRSDANVLQFWLEKKFTEPELFELSNICFAIPTTQVTDERQLSALESVLKNNRNCLSVDALEDKLLVQQNPNYLDDAIETLSLFEDCPEDIEVDFESE